MRRLAKADVNPIRQRSQFSCVSTSTCMALNAVGVKCNEDQVNQVIGAKPMQGARWEEVLACAQYFGCRATLTTPATLTQVKAWTDQGKPVLIAWNPEGRDWSHASLIFDVTGEKGNFVVHIADPNMPNPDKTTREVNEDDFYAKWYEKWPNYLVRRPALMIEREITEDGRQIMANNQTDFVSAVKEIVSSVKHLGFLTMLDKWSCKSDANGVYLVYKVAVPGVGNYSLEFEKNGEGEGNAFLFEGRDLIRTCRGISTFPEIINHLPSTTSKMANVLPCLQSEVDVSDEQLSQIIMLAQGGLSRKELAIEIANMLPNVKPDAQLSIIDLVLRDINNRMASKKKKNQEPSIPKYRDPNAQGMFDGTGVGSSGKGKHKNRNQDVAKGRSRKRKHKEDLRREMMAEKLARVHLERKKWVESPPKQFDQEQQEQLWTIYDLSYSKVGKHISSKSALMNNYDIFWVVDVVGDDEIDAFVSYSTTSFGKKIGLIGSDGTSEGRNAMLMKGAELLLKRGWYAEVDSRFARLLKKKLRVNHVQDEDLVRVIINKPLEWDEDKKCYTRNLEGKGDVVKYLVGIPNI